MPDPDGMHPYWLDLAQILRIKPLLRDGDMRAVAQLKNEMSDKVFATFIRNREMAASGRIGAQAVTPPQPDLPGVGQAAPSPGATGGSGP